MYGNVVVYGVIAAGTLGPFVNAFCTELGKRLGGTVADWASRVHLQRRRDDSDGADLVVEANDSTTVLELSESMTDEAKLALLDLDITDVTIRGHRLRWDAQSASWATADKQS
jgi:hypothetical protein